MASYRAVLGDTVLAESDRAPIVEGNVYFPPDAVAWQHLQPTRTRSLCPWKGIASYFTVSVPVPGGQQPEDRNAAWTYRRPSPLARRIKGHVAFWGAVRVEQVDPVVLGRPGAAAPPAHR